eukprot:m.476878 g.476878  ORF g.476878 m.476878 type:complete len:541 (-) comp20685_c0_seq1:133-1755(-)
MAMTVMTQAPCAPLKARLNTPAQLRTFPHTINIATPPTPMIDQTERMASSVLKGGRVVDHVARGLDVAVLEALQVPVANLDGELRGPDKLKVPVLGARSLSTNAGSVDSQVSAVESADVVVSLCDVEGKDFGVDVVAAHLIGLVGAEKAVGGAEHELRAVHNLKDKRRLVLDTVKVGDEGTVFLGTDVLAVAGNKGDARAVKLELENVLGSVRLCVTVSHDGGRTVNVQEIVGVGPDLPPTVTGNLELERLSVTRVVRLCHCLHTRANRHLLAHGNVGKLELRVRVLDREKLVLRDAGVDGAGSVELATAAGDREVAAARAEERNLVARDDEDKQRRGVHGPLEAAVGRQEAAIKGLKGVLAFAKVEGDRGISAPRNVLVRRHGVSVEVGVLLAHSAAEDNLGVHGELHSPETVRGERGLGHLGGEAVELLIVTAKKRAVDCLKGPAPISLRHHGEALAGRLLVGISGNLVALGRRDVAASLRLDVHLAVALLQHKDLLLLERGGVGGEAKPKRLGRQVLAVVVHESKCPLHGCWLTSVC